MAARAARAARRSAVSGRARGARQPHVLEPEPRVAGGRGQQRGAARDPRLRRRVLAHALDGLRRAGGHDADRLGGGQRVLDGERAEPAAPGLGHGAVPLQGRRRGRLVLDRRQRCRPVPPDERRRLPGGGRLLVRRHRLARPHRHARRRVPPALGRREPAHGLQRHQRARGQRHRAAGDRLRRVRRGGSAARRARDAGPAAAGVAAAAAAPDPGRRVHVGPVRPAAEADGGSELLALDAEPGGVVWAVGGGAASGDAVAARGAGGVVPRAPLAAVSRAGNQFRELPLSGATFGTADRFEDVAAVPGTLSAWAALVPYADRGRTNAKAQVARIDAATARPRSRPCRPPVPAAGRRRGSRSPRHRRLDGHQRRLAVPLLRRHAAAEGHRPGVRRPDHDASERGRRAVRARHGAGRRLAAVRAAARGDRDGADRGPGAGAAGGADQERPQAAAQGSDPAPELQGDAQGARSARRAAQGQDGRQDQEPHAQPGAAHAQAQARAQALADRAALRDQGADDRRGSARGARRRHGRQHAPRADEMRRAWLVVVPLLLAAGAWVAALAGRSRGRSARTDRAADAGHGGPRDGADGRRGRGDLGLPRAAARGRSAGRRRDRRRRKRQQLAFLRFTPATGWQVVETPADAGGATIRGPGPEPQLRADHARCGRPARRPLQRRRQACSCASRAGASARRRRCPPACSRPRTRPRPPTRPRPHRRRRPRRP